MIIGAAADAARTPLREIFMKPPNLVIRVSALSAASVALFSSPANTPTKSRAAPLTYRTVGIGQDIVLKPISESRERFTVYRKAV